MTENQSLSVHYNNLLLDCDGVVYLGQKVIEAAKFTLANLPEHTQTWFVTNNAYASTSEVAARLQGFGIAAVAGQVQTSAKSTATLMRQELPAGAKVLVVGGPGLHEAVSDAGFDVVRDHTAHPVAVIHGYNPENTWAAITEICYAIGFGATYYATNMDANMPDHIGFAPGNGALSAAIVTATGVQPRVGGKPEPIMYEQLITEANRSTSLAVGDRLDTDISGANGAGIDSLAVLTGVLGPQELLQAHKDHRPTHIGLDLQALLLPPLALEVQHNTVVCGLSRVAVTAEGAIKFSGPDDTLEALWASCHLAWQMGQQDPAFTQLNEHWQHRGKPVD